MDRKTKNRAIGQLKKLDGLPPYDGGDNICKGDGYFANSIGLEFGMSIAELSKKSGYDKIKRRWESTHKRFLKK